MMLYLFGLLVVSWISFSDATIPPAADQQSLNECSNAVHERAAYSTYVVKIDPDNSEAVDNETCHPSPTKPSTVPCKSLDYAFQQNYSIGDSLVFSLVSSDSVYTLTSNATFQNLSGICIVGNSSTTDPPVNVKCVAPNSGLAFLHSNSIEIRYVRFIGCGAEHESTSRDFASPEMRMILINVTLYFYNCSVVDMYRVEVYNSSQATGVVMYDTNGQIQVTECIFYNNSAAEYTLGGGGFAVEFTYCSPGNTACSNNFTEYYPGYRSVNVPAEYNFIDCHFEQNVARSQNYTSSAGNLIFASLANHTAIGRGGGLSIYFKGIARNKSVNITNCNFTKNGAVWGGGLLIEMDDNTITNKVKICNCTFIANHAFFREDYGTGGGALRIAITLYFWTDTYQKLRNEILIEHSNFTKNKAIQGGAMSFSIARQRLSYLSQVTNLLISDCIFDGNVAQLGSAVFGTLYPIFSDGFIAPLNFSMCHFLSNHISNRLYEKNQNDSLRSHPAGMGAVYVNEVPTTFSNLANFSTNRGSALTVIGTCVNFTGTYAHFYNNSGSTGGAVALLGASSILTGPNTVMEFNDNSASIHGGAVYNRYISREDLTSSVNCFFRYSDPFVSPFNWNATFNFSRNVAKKLGNSIYSTAALPCSWARPSGGKNIFCNEQQWHFFGSNCTDEVYTEARRMQLRKDVPSQIEAFPGHGFFLLLDAFDDFDHNVTNDTVYAANIQSPDAEVDPTYAYVAHNYVAITGKPGMNVDMNMYTAGSRTTYIKLNLTIQPCPPGFRYTYDNYSDIELEGDHLRTSSKYYLHDEDLDKYTSCTCPPSNVTQFRGNLYCFAHEFRSQIQNRFWIGMQNQIIMNNDSENYPSELLMGLVPQYYTTNAPYGNEYIYIPRNYSSINDFICGVGNRNGTLCGQCRDGYAVAINSRIYECVSCKNISISERAKNICIYLALTYLPILGLFFAIIIFNFKLTSSAALSFVLFAQMIGSGVFSLTAGEAFYLQNRHVRGMEKAYTTIYGFFNLNSLAFLMEPFCINENLTTLHVLTLEYIIAAFPIAMIIVIYLGHRCCTVKCECYERRRRARLAQSADPSSTATIQSTDKSTQRPRSTLIHAFVAFLFLSYTKFSLASMFTMSLTELFNENGTSSGTDYIYFAGHMRFSDRDYLRYGLPAIFILIFIVIIPPLLLLGPIQFIDWLIDKRGFRWLQRVWPSITIHTFLDTFQGFYKPNRRFFSGIYFLFRLAVFLDFSFSKTIMGQYIFQQIAVTVLIVLVALFRPYIRNFYNYLDVLILCNLSILNALAIYIFTNRFSSFPYRVYVVECILVWWPLLYILCYAVWNRMHHRKQYNTVKAKVVRLVTPSKFSQDDAGTIDEREQLLGNNPNIFADRSLDESIHVTNEDPDERLFRRATRRNRYRSTNQNVTQSPGSDSRAAAPVRPASVSSMVVSMWKDESAAEKDLVKRDSGTSTGGSSRSGLDSNDS